MIENNFRITSTGQSSAKYGPCEICGQHVSEVFILADDVNATYFGHKACLKGKLRDIEYDHFLANPPEEEATP